MTGLPFALAALLTLAALPAAAQTPMTAAEFQAYVGTATLTYDYSSGSRGSADYGPNRTLRWAFHGEPCVTATWHQQGDQICFVFDDPQMTGCWHFYLDAKGLRGISLDAFEDLQIFEAARSDAPLACAGPEVGV